MGLAALASCTRAQMPFAAGCDLWRCAVVSSRLCEALEGSYLTQPGLMHSKNGLY